MQAMVSECVEMIKKLSSITKTQHHNIYSVFNHGLSIEGRIFFWHVIPDIANLFQPLEEAISSLP